MIPLLLLLFLFAPKAWAGDCKNIYMAKGHSNYEQCRIANALERLVDTLSKEKN